MAGAEDDLPGGTLPLNWIRVQSIFQSFQGFTAPVAMARASRPEPRNPHSFDVHPVDNAGISRDDLSFYVHHMQSATRRFRCM